MTSEFYFNLRSYVHYNLEVPVYGESSFQGRNVSYPCVLFTRDGSGGQFSHTGPALRQDVVTFSCKSRVLEEAETMRDTLIEMLDGYSVECVIVQDSEVDDFDADTGVYSRDLSFTVLYGADFEYFQPVSGQGTPNQIAVFEKKYVLTGSNAIQITGSNITISGSLTVLGPTNIQVTGTIDNAVSSSHAVYADTAGTAINANNATNANYAVVAAFALSGSLSASYASTASLSYNSNVATSASYATYAQNAGTATTSTSASFATNSTN